MGERLNGIQEVAGSIPVGSTKIVAIWLSAAANLFPSVGRGMKKHRRDGMKLVARDVQPDARKRIALGRALEELDDASFNVYRDDRGTIVLDPQVSVPASEAWLYRNKKALESIRRGLTEAAEEKLIHLGSFAGYADDES